MTAVVLTGPSRGIGRATAFELASRGIPLALLGRQSPALDQTLAELERCRTTVKCFPCDLRKPGDIANAARSILDAVGTPIAVIHNAAVIHRGLVEDLTDEQWNEQLEVNVRGPFLLTRALLPSMKAAHAGRIVCVGSISATLGTRGASAYCASKWALVGFMKSLAEELSDTGLMTVAILPGSVDTEMLHGSGFTPRMTAEDVARTIAFYTLDAPSSHNGGVVEMFGV